MPERKNIFLIGRQGHRGDENQLTEMLAFLWQEVPESLSRWLAALGIAHANGPIEVQTQFVLPGGKRPDVAITANDLVVLVESKLGAGLTEEQVAEYVRFLESRHESTRVLVLVTQQPQPHMRTARRVRVEWSRWQELAETLGEAGAESLAGDFLQVLVREGLVKPQALQSGDWTAWNLGYQVLLRLDSLLTEVTPLLQTRYRDLKSSNAGLTKRWIYRLWKSDDANIQIGLGFGAAADDRDADTAPIIFSQVLNKTAGKAAGAAAIQHKKWQPIEGIEGTWGLLWGEWPTRSRWAAEVLTGASFSEQVDQAVEFISETVRFLEAAELRRAGLVRTRFRCGRPRDRAVTARPPP